MATQRIVPSPESTRPSTRPAVTTYDSGYEHSLEHMLEVRRLVAQATEEPARPSVKAVRPVVIAQAATS